MNIQTYGVTPFAPSSLRYEFILKPLMISTPRLFTKHCIVFSVFNDTLVRRVRVTERLHFLQGVYLRS